MSRKRIKAYYQYEERKKQMRAEQRLKRTATFSVKSVTDFWLYRYRPLT